MLPTPSAPLFNSSAKLGFAYRPDIDGLRAIAVIAVVLYHAHLGARGGFIGVDVFFVISGYLITCLILRDIGSHSFHLVSFWERRARRILPALAVVSAATFLVGWFILTPDDLTDLSKSLLAQLGFSSNVYFWKTLDYFNADSHYKPLLHTWSLAVEEQYYLIFPLFLVAIARFGKRHFLLFTLALTAISLGLSIFATSRYPTGSFYLLPSRAWELLVGCLLAIDSGIIRGQLLKPPRSILPRELLSWIGLAGILIPVFLYDAGTAFPGIAAIPPVVGTALIIWTNSSTPTSLGRLLMLRPFVLVGLISYSLYLWHFPALAFLHYWNVELPSLSVRLVLLPVLFAIAFLSWRYVETPFRKRTICSTRRSVFTFAGMATSVLAICAVGAVVFDGVPNRLDPKLQRLLVEKSERHAVNDTGLGALRSGTIPMLGNRQEFTDGNPDKLDLLLWGDSHAKIFVPLLDELCANHSLRAAFTVKGGTTPLQNYESRNRRRAIRENAVEWNSAVIDFVQRHRPANVLLVARWGIQDHDDDFPNNLSETVETLEQYGSTVWIMRDVPVYENDVTKLLLREARSSRDLTAIGLSRTEYHDQLRRQDIAFQFLQETSARILDPEPYLVTQSGRCVVMWNDRPAYFDDNHLTRTGSELLRPLLDTVARAAATRAIEQTQL